MKSHLKAAVALTAAALLGGCASSGGGGQASLDPGLCVILYGPLCPDIYGSSSAGSSDGSPASSTQTQGTFTSWADLRRDTNSEVTGFYTSVGYKTRPDGSIGSVSEATSPNPAATSHHFVRYDRLGNAVNFALGGGGGDPSWSTAQRTLANLGGIGHSWADIGYRNIVPGSPQTPFANLPARELEIVANPYVAGWNYQSFGAWNVTDPSWVNFGGTSFGAATPASAVPTSGTSTFTGKLGGLYVSPTGQGSIAAADLTVNANFSTRSLGFATSGTTTTRDLATATAAPNLNLSGTLTYSPSANSFTGTLVNAGGTMSGSTTGRYYGPAAQELGGVFTVKSPTSVETFAGAYGAKR